MSADSLITPNQVSVQDFLEAYSKEGEIQIIAGSEAGLRRRIREPTVNRPGLAFAGFTQYFACKRVQVLGKAEAAFLRSLDEDERLERFRSIFGAPFRVPCLVICRNIRPHKALLQAANELGTPILQSPLITRNFIRKANLALETLFAPRGSCFGSMVDILGIGVLVQGESGIGKSECVLDLIERGYSLVSDDITKVRQVDGHDVVGYSNPNTKDHMEVRGIGIINVAAMFGVKCIRQEKRIDLVVSLVKWENVKDVDRLGIDETYTSILDTQIPLITIPVREGRDISRLVEVAALQTKLKMMGRNTAEEFNQRLIAQMSSKSKK